MSSLDPVIGRKINNYEITDILGRGGMGRGYLARHPHIGKQVAVQLLKSDPAADSETAPRFFHEARVVNEIRHEHVIDILDFGQTPEGECYILMEYLEGLCLTEIVEAEGPLPKLRVGDIGLQVCSALYATHQKGII